MIAILGVMGLVLAAILILSGVAQGKTAEISASGSASGAIPSLSIDQLISKNSRRFGVEEALIRAHIQVESSGNPNASNPLDPSWGLMGITPICAQDYGFVLDWHNPTAEEIANLRRPEINIEIGTRHLSYLHGKYDFTTATQMYNCGEFNFNVKGVRVPEYLSRVRRWYDEFRTA
jgi:soluble lytic murein transglycosylase-like protein